MPDNKLKLTTKICNKLQLFTRLTTITGFTPLVSCIEMLCVKVQLHALTYFTHVGLRKMTVTAVL